MNRNPVKNIFKFQLLAALPIIVLLLSTSCIPTSESDMIESFLKNTDAADGDQAAYKNEDYSELAAQLVNEIF